MIYLASPYSHPDAAVREQRFQDVCRCAATLMAQGKMIFSPIAHTHPIAQYGLPLGWDFWERYDREHIAACDGLIVLMLEGWSDSKGVQAEIRIASEMEKPVTYLNPIGPPRCHKAVAHAITAEAAREEGE